jgi:hypothetical protein
LLVRKISLREAILKYAKNVDLKAENDGLGGNLSKKIGFFENDYTENRLWM